MIDKSDCSRDFSKKITKKHPHTHIKIRNCNDFENSLNFAKVSRGENCKVKSRIMECDKLPHASVLFEATEHEWWRGIGYFYLRGATICRIDVFSIKKDNDL